MMIQDLVFFKGIVMKDGKMTASFSKHTKWLNDLIDMEKLVVNETTGGLEYYVIPHGRQHWPVKPYTYIVLYFNAQGNDRIMVNRKVELV